MASSHSLSLVFSVSWSDSIDFWRVSIFSFCSVICFWFFSSISILAARSRGFPHFEQIVESGAFGISQILQIFGRFFSSCSCCFIPKWLKIAASTSAFIKWTYFAGIFDSGDQPCLFLNWASVINLAEFVASLCLNMLRFTLFSRLAIFARRETIARAAA